MLLYQTDCLNKLPEFKDNPTKVYFTLMELSGEGELSLLQRVIEDSGFPPQGCPPFRHLWATLEHEELSWATH